MIHELIDQKKRTFRSNTARSTKTVSDNNKNLTDNPNLEQSDNDNKEVDSSSTTFIPPWLRNSLGLNQKTNQSHTTSDQKSTRIIPRYKEHSNNDFENLKGNFDQDCSVEPADQFGNCLAKNCDAEISLTHEPDVIQTSCNNGDKAVPVLWENVSKDSEIDLSTSPDLSSKLSKREESTLTSNDVMTSYEIDKIRDEEKKRLKLTRQKNRLKRRTVNDQKPSELGKDEVNLLLEMKAREVLHNYTKKNVHSSASDIKQLEAKLILLSARCDNVDASKLDAHDLRLLQEINEQIGSKEDFEKLIEHIKETNLKEILRGPDGMTKALGDKLKKFEENLISNEKEDRGIKDVIQNSKCGEDGNNSNIDQESMGSTDDENDIKRFSDFLSKNKNVDEKRKCLEEVRSYFEKKRRTRMTKRRPMDESKIPRSLHSGDKRDDFVKDKLKFKDVPILLNSKEKKLKMRCDEEVVEKAVNETLQKFVDLYHFHVSPSVLGTVRKNILQAIQSDSLEFDLSKQSLKDNQENGGNSGVRKTEKPCSDKESEHNDKEELKDQACSFSDGDNIVDGVSIGNISNKEGKKRNFKTLSESSGCQDQKSVKENDIVENEHIKRLKREFETFLNSIQAHADITGLKLQSIILEKEEQSSASKNLQFVYNFTKKSLESNKANQESGPSFVKEGKTSKIYKDTEVQTPGKTYIAKRNIKIQTCSTQVYCNRNLQTESVSYVTSDVQTDELGITLKELGDLKGDDISTGLYRMIKSREKGKFYLYPEDLDESKTQVVYNKSSTSLLQSHDCATNTDINEILWNDLCEEKISKEKNILFKEKESKFRKNRRNNVYASCFPQKFAAKKENLVPDIENSLSCLFFRSSANKTPESVTKTNSTTDEGMLYKGDTSKKAAKDAAQENHLGCVWFWNGEKITPGCDLKVHVEDLLAQKLKEISSTDGHGNKASTNDRGITKDENYDQGGPVEKSTNEATNIEVKNIFCYERDSSPAVETPPLVFSEESECLANEKKVEEDSSAQNVETIILDGAKNEEKRVRDVGTQNSQQTFLSLNITRLRSRSKTVSSGKCCKRKSKRKSFIVKPVRENQGSLINIKKPSDVAKAVQKLKKMKLKIEKVRSSDTTSSTPSMAEGSTTSSTSKNFSEDPVAVILGLRKNSEGDGTAVMDVKNKIKKIIGLVDHEVQTSNTCNVDQDYCPKKTSKPSEMENSKHWELIENVLNRISQKERESLWNDIRDFIKKKIGRDINDEGAREVCIEIEQDMPKSAQGRTKHAVLARGHYKRNEGDVEVEIDLTLDDLERILRHRQKKIRRRQWSSTSKSRKLLSSSSTHSDFRKMISEYLGMSHYKNRSKRKAKEKKKRKTDLSGTLARKG